MRDATLLNHSFNELPWHDAEIEEIVVDRRAAGERDEVRLLIVWPNGASEELTFEECYAVDMNLNFGIICSETVRTGYIDDQDMQLLRIRQIWKLIGVELDQLICFKIETNSTGSIIRIFSVRCSRRPIQIQKPGVGTK